jgi:hypothetical protein
MIFSTGISCFASALATARMARCTDVGGMSVAIEMVRTLSPALISSSTTMRRRAVSARVPGRVPGFLLNRCAARVTRAWRSRVVFGTPSRYPLAAGVPAFRSGSVQLPAFRAESDPASDGQHPISSRIRPFQYVHNAADGAAIISSFDPAHVRRQVRFDPLPLLIVQPK